VETASGRAFVTRRLREFSQLGIVALSRGKVEILEKPKLEQIALDGM
jgi:CRP/FNR family transcriptional regulator